MSHYRKFDPPFDIPDSWEWVSLGDYLINRDGERIPVSLNIRSKQTNKIYDYYGAVGVIDKVNDFLFNERLLLIGEDGANLISRAKDNAFFADGRYWVNNHAHILDATDKSLLDFVSLYINAIALDNYVTGSAQPKLSQDSLNRIQVPIPPYTEQIRILNSVQSYSDIIDFINHEKRVIQKTINLIKSKILDLAMQGKLVPQDPSDESAADMLRRINPKAKIITDTPHYLPATKRWIFCELQDVSQITMGQSPNGDSINNEDGLEFHQGKLYFGNTILSISPDRTRTPIKIIDGDNILLCVRAPVGIVNKCNRRICIGRGLAAISPSEVVSNDFLFYVLKYLRPVFEVKSTGSTFKAITGDVIKTTVIPLPPLNEQTRIAAKIKKLYSILDELEASLQS